MHCKKCLHYELCVKIGKPSLYGINQEIGCSSYKDKTKWAEKKDAVTNADRIRAMSDEELAKEMLFFCPTDTVFKGEDTFRKPHYTGLDRGYYATSEEVVASNFGWLKQPAE